MGVSGSAVCGLGWAAIGLSWGFPRCLLTYLAKASPVLLVVLDVSRNEFWWLTGLDGMFDCDTLPMDIVDPSDTDGTRVLARVSDKCTDTESSLRVYGELKTAVAVVNQFYMGQGTLDIPRTTIAPTLNGMNSTRMFEYMIVEAITRPSSSRRLKTLLTLKSLMASA